MALCMGGCFGRAPNGTTKLQSMVEVGNRNHPCMRQLASSRKSTRNITLIARFGSNVSRGQGLDGVCVCPRWGSGFRLDVVHVYFFFIRAGILDFGPSGAATVSRPLSAPWSSRCSPVDCYFLFLPGLEQGPMSSAILGPAARSRTALAGKPGNLRLHCLVACAGKPGNLRFHRLVACAGKPGNLQIRRLVAWAGKPGNLRFHSLGARASKPGNLRFHCLVAWTGKPVNLRFHQQVAWADKPSNLRFHRLVAWTGKPGNPIAWLLGQASHKPCDFIAWLLGQASQETWNSIALLLGQTSRETCDSVAWLLGQASLQLCCNYAEMPHAALCWPGQRSTVDP